MRSSCFFLASAMAFRSLCLVVSLVVVRNEAISTGPSECIEVSRQISRGQESQSRPCLDVEGRYGGDGKLVIPPTPNDRSSQCDACGLSSQKRKRESYWRALSFQIEVSHSCLLETSVAVQASSPWPQYCPAHGLSYTKSILTYLHSGSMKLVGCVAILFQIKTLLSFQHQYSPS